MEAEAGEEHAPIVGKQNGRSSGVMPLIFQSRVFPFGNGSSTTQLLPAQWSDSHEDWLRACEWMQ